MHVPTVQRFGLSFIVLEILYLVSTIPLQAGGSILAAFLRCQHLLFVT